MEQPPEEAPEVREEEEKEEVAQTQGAAELNGEPEHPLPSSSYTGEEAGTGRPAHSLGSAGEQSWAPVVLKPLTWLRPRCAAQQLQTVGRAPHQAGSQGCRVGSVTVTGICVCHACGHDCSTTATARGPSD